MRFGRVVSLVVSVLVLMTAVPAFAACAFGCGGGYDAFSYRTEYLWPGQTVTWSTEAYMDKNAAWPDDGPFFAYLVESRRLGARAPRVEGGTRLATVETERAGRLLFDVSVTFTVPANTPTGSYAVEVCDDPCTNRLGYFGPTQVEIVSGGIEARLQPRIVALSEKVSNLRRSMKSQARRAARNSSDVLRMEVEAMEEQRDLRLSELALRVTDLERQIASQQEPEDREDVSQSALAGGIVVLLLCGWLLRERARNRHPLVTAQSVE
ncbi:hypothetical protein BH20ACT23_BH20ACT23_18650 [soil metagenome]